MIGDDIVTRKAETVCLQSRVSVRHGYPSGCATHLDTSCKSVDGLSNRHVELVVGSTAASNQSLSQAEEFVDHLDVFSQLFSSKDGSMAYCEIRAIEVICLLAVDEGHLLKI